MNKDIFLHSVNCSFEGNIGYKDRANFYEVEYAETADQYFLRSLITPKVKSVLEIPCGVGRNALQLAESGAKVVAVDREPAMIRKLKKRIGMLHNCKNLEPLEGDMVSLNLQREFDLIIVPREAFQMIIEDHHALQVLKRLKFHLSRNGSMVIDLATFKKSKLNEQSIQPDYYDPNLPDGDKIFDWTKKISSGDIITRHRIQQHYNKFVEIEYHYDIRRLSGKTEKWVSKVTLRVYTKEDFTALAKCAGLIPDKIIRNYLYEPFESGAVRMIFFLNLGR